MPYRIIYRHAFNTTSEESDASLGEAQEIAVSSITSGAADYVEIRNIEGILVDCYPSTVLWRSVSGIADRE